MKTKAFTALFLFIFVFTGLLTGQSFNKSKQDSLLDLLALKNKAMGSLTIQENGNILYTRAIGYRSISSQQKVVSDEKTKYRIGSISKMFTATLIFQLIEENNLELSVTLDKYFPTIPNAGTITIGQMLSHRSGIHSFTDDSAYQQWCYEPKTRDEIISLISNSKPEFEPGSKTAYSNSNFVLLGYIIEKITGKPYSQVLEERIASKIGLKDTYYGGKTEVSKNESFSYTFDGKSWQQSPETDMSIPHGAGAIVSTPSDLVKFIDALFNGKLVSETSLNHMKTITDGMGMGMQQFPYEDRKIYGHGGAIDGFNSLLCYFPEEKLAVAYCSNGTVYSINDILLGSLSNYYGKPYALPVFTTYAVTSEELDQYLGLYSSPQVPIKITFTKKDSVLYGQGTGQPSFPLEATAKHVFKFEMAGIVVTFLPEKNEMILEQGGGKFTFTKEIQD